MRAASLSTVSPAGNLDEGVGVRQAGHCLGQCAHANVLLVQAHAHHQQTDVCGVRRIEAV